MEKILWISLGCDKNLVDSENMIGLLKKHGYQFTDNEEEATVIVVNSCCFIHDAKEESINTIIEMGQYKNTGNLKALIVCGCLAERYKDEIESELPEVDAIVGTSSIDKIIDVVKEVIDESTDENNHEIIKSFDDISREAHTFADRESSNGSFTSYLKIAEGCNKCCTYCIIPKVRGKYRSIPMEELVSEAKRLAQNGTKELILVAQETTLYGLDLYGEKSLHKLLNELGKINELLWIRILYCYPEEIYDELIEEMAVNKKVCHYLDIPIQHACDSILKRMGRRTNKADLIEVINKLRSRIPDIALRTTLITGFPGETEEDHEELMEFVDEMEFDRLGVFTYSAEEDTPAALFDNQVDEEVKLTRKDEIMELQQEVSADKNAALVGSEFIVIIEGYMPADNIYVGRTYMDAPSVDGNIFIETGETLVSGDVVRVKVTGAYEYDLIGELI